MRFGWFAAIGPLGVLHLWFFLILIPWAVMRNRRRVPLPAPDQRRLHYQRVVGQLAVFGVFAALVAQVSRLVWWAPPVWPLVTWAATLAVVALLFVGLDRYRRRRIAEGEPRTLLLAHGPEDRLWWAAVSLAAGVSEELAYRGVSAMLLLRAGAPVWAVVLVVNAAFGLAHAPRGWLHVGITFGMGVAFHALVLFSGSLWPAMAAHFAHDLLAGLAYSQLARQQQPVAA